MNNHGVAVCGMWFTAHGIGENLGHVLAGENAGIMEKLRAVFSAWYSNRHVDESDPNTYVLRIRLTNGFLIEHESNKRYDIDFEKLTA
ncbi:MAG: hypothetical protein FWE91_10080 [Defluviitaleaceae bacterium]|nr:hypothetical protein [Defluviitaleaceae bacterium]MCL2835801.1 hypothetical protein [Defluviitaleaceae bacterium]